MVVRDRQSFQFFKQNTWFLEDNRALSKFLHGILHYQLVLPNYKKNHSIKPNFILTTRATLICCARKIKDFYQSSLGNEVDFRDNMNVSPNI